MDGIFQHKHIILSIIGSVLVMAVISTLFCCCACICCHGSIINKLHDRYSKKDYHIINTNPENGEEIWKRRLERV